MGKLWTGGTIYTLTEEGETVEAVYADKGIIIAVGTLDELKARYEKSIEEIIDLKGATMFPGFVDSHLHMIGHGEKLLRLDLSGMTSAQDMREALIERAAQAKTGEWIIGDGWNENNFPDRKIFHRQELDEIAPNNPMVLSRVCRHAILANSKAMEAASITDETANPEGGVIVRDLDGVATGFLLDAAQDLVKNVMPGVTREYLHNSLATSIDDLSRMGLVGGHTEDLNYYGGFEKTFDTFLETVNPSARKFRCNLLVHHGVLDEMERLGYGKGDGNEFVELGSVKIFADGALGGRTALLSEPYNDAPEMSGVAIQSQEELTEIVKKARKFKMPVAIHAIGDLAMEFAINAIEQYPPVEDGQRDRLIHGQVLREDLIERMKKLPIIVDIQPHFVASDFPWVIERLGEHRMKYAFAWKTLLKQGIICAAGSDAPIETADPLRTIHAAVTRRKFAEEHEGYYPEEKLSVYEAIELYTKGSALAISQEDMVGIIAEGYLADFTVLERDLLKIDVDEIPNTTVLMTVIGNEMIYKK